MTDKRHTDILPPDSSISLRKPTLLTTALLSSAYFGPVQWYQKLNRYDTCFIEQHDHFIKQTYRNRCVIATTHGTQTLSIPIEHYDGAKCPMRDIRISNHGNWRHLHWNALLSAYGESPFFEFYADDIRPFFERQWTFLFDFNMEITRQMCTLLDIEPDIRFTDRYMPSVTSSPLSEKNGGDMPLVDYRDAIRPKHPQPDKAFAPRRYYQVFAQKNGFLPNLSILDLLFNEGNEAVLFL